MDKTTKIILALIAAGLWANIIAPAAHAQDAALASIAQNISAIASGICTNHTLCQ
jgi:hypothetical protein